MSANHSVRIAVACLVLGLVLTLPVSAAMAVTSAKATSPELTPTRVCSCSSASGADTSSSSELRGHGFPSPNTKANYDEQLGITFAQSFTSMEYNVTAVAQTDPTLGTGPAYLLNGLTSNGFWYQVGVSYDWEPGQTPGTGFDMNYEVFDPFGASIYPPQSGGLESFSGPVHEGDTIVLNLYFGSSGKVFMIAEDLITGAYAEQTFSAEGASYFVGLPNEIANGNGYFTGLMTEWYHGAPYSANLEAVTYSTTTTVGSGWMWMDEWNPNNNVALFAANASSASSFTDQPAKLQEFSYSSITEYADATEFVTGAIVVLEPSSTSPVSSLDHTNLAIIVSSIALVLVAVAVALATRRKSRTWTVDGQTPIPSPEELGPPPTGGVYSHETAIPHGIMSLNTLLISRPFWAKLP